MNITYLVHLYYSHFSWEHIYTGTVYTNLPMNKLKSFTNNLIMTSEQEHIYAEPLLNPYVSLAAALTAAVLHTV